MVVQGRCEMLDLGQDVPAVFCCPGGKCQGQQLRAYLPRSTKCLMQAHHTFLSAVSRCTTLQSFVMGEHSPVVSICWLLMVPWSWKHHFTGVGDVEEGQRKLDQPVLLCLIEGGTLKTIQFLCYISTERPRLIKRPQSKILYKGFINH